MTQLLMPKATAVWLIDNTALTFDQIGDFCNLHPLEVQAIADGEIGDGMQGYDPVAYFNAGEPTKGSYKVTSSFDDATYWFATEENKALFEANPEAYIPAYGGYCAFGAAMGFKFDGDPNQWKIVDDVLYLNLSKDIQERWAQDIPGFIEKADVNWDNIEDKSPAELLEQ